MSKKRFSGLRLILMVPVVVLLAGGLIIGGRALQEPGEVRTLKRQEVAQADEGHELVPFHGGRLVAAAGGVLCVPRTAAHRRRSGARHGRDAAGGAEAYQRVVLAGG